MTGTIGLILLTGAVGGGGLLAYHEYTLHKNATAASAAASNNGLVGDLEAEGEKLLGGSGNSNPLSSLWDDLTGSDSGTEDSNPTIGNTGASSSSGGGEDEPTGGGDDDNSD